jgi:hypothetical protein
VTDEQNEAPEGAQEPAGEPETAAEPEAGPETQDDDPDQEGAEASAQATTQGDLVPGPDEHPVDTTPPTGDGPQGDAHEPMSKADERGEPNTRGQGGGDGTVWNG